MPNDLLILLATRILLVEIYRKLRQIWLQHLLSQKRKAKRAQTAQRKPPVLRPKSERDWRFYQEDQRKRKSPEREAPLSWYLRKGKSRPKKNVSTAGYFCPNEKCAYYGISDEQTHALVGYGKHGVHEEILDFKCQACGNKFTARRNTVLYRLKRNSGLVEKILWLIALGVDASALEEVFGVREVTIRTWLCRSGMQSQKLHERFLAELELVHVQLDELWANVKNGSQDMWLWVAHDATTKLIPVMRVVGRSLEIAFSVVHELKGRLAVGCVPVFSCDGLYHYYNVLTANFRKWEWAGGKKPVWVLLRDFVYSQVIKHQRRRRTVEVERRVLVGEASQYRERLCQAGLSGQINTSFVEWLYPTIRQCVSKLPRRTWGPAWYTSELLDHLEWWRSYYHFFRPHESLVVELLKPTLRKGNNFSESTGSGLRRWRPG